ncbi:MAG: flotillin-like FloA family protein, partial [Candidatus Omnitrophica bacterium]|nr:flotillin-like FloA family protein [Candidatus Omnitrophota bacterium]
ASQAEADLKVAQARAETRRALAVAQEQEMKAKAQEMRAKVIEAEAQIPLAIAQAFKEGKLGVLDYYNLRNIQADTSMREKIAQTQTGKEDSQKQI